MHAGTKFGGVSNQFTRVGEQSMLTKRIVILAAVVVVLATLATFSEAVLAAPNAPFETQIVRGEVNFTIPAGQCTQLPPDVEITGTGHRVQAISTKVKSNGTELLMSNDFVTGTAEDGDGGTYTFIYSNQARYTDPEAEGGTVGVNMTDSFILDHTNGDNDYAAGFQWKWTYSPPDPEWPPVDDWQQNLTIGDPLTCDPI
jgi:hypothetical protein